MSPPPTVVIPSIPLRSSTPLISAASGVVAGAAPHLGLNMAAVIYFDRGSARVDKRGRDALHKVADYLKQSRGALRVVGHASNRTKELSSASHELVNFNISFKRARAVADELIRRGVSPDRLKITALSDSAPVYREWMPSGEAGNRRAEVFIDF
ncbi:MAG: OmpA family protein [Proteobacteria bacterium]|nr:OmpA family protein [Pseudomonadota bacterium]